MALSTRPWYAGYAALGLDAFGLSPAEDQQLAGLLMWLPGGLVHAAAGIALLARGLVDVPSRPPTAAALLAVALAVPAAARAETAYVSDEQANVVHAISADGHDTPIPVGHRPRGIVLGHDGRTLLVAASGDDRIDIVDLRTRKVVGHLPSGTDPERFALSPDGRRLYVANEDAAKVSAIDVASRRVVGEVGVGAEPEGIAVSPDGRRIVATSETASLAHFIDAGTMKLVESRMVGTRPRDAMFSPDGRWLWVSSEMRATATLFDMRTRTPVRVVDFDRDARAPGLVQAVGMVFAPDASRLYVALGRGDNGLSGDVGVVDIASGRLERTIRTGGKPWGVVVGP